MKIQIKFGNQLSEIISNTALKQHVERVEVKGNYNAVVITN